MSNLLCRTCPSTRRGDRLHAWAYRIRTFMCKVKIHLFELSAMSGFSAPAQTVLVVPGE
jgi:hypothetical protein